MRHVTGPFVRFLLLVSVFQHAISASPAGPRTDAVLVTQVPDGDTIVVSGTGRVALVGVLAPPIVRPPRPSEAIAAEARDRLAGLVLNRWVRLEYEGASRSAAYVWLETGVLVNAAVLEAGLARLTLKPGASAYAQMAAAQERAERGRRGVWR